MEVEKREALSRFDMTKRRFFRNKIGVIASIYMLIVIVAIILVEFISPYPKDEYHYDYMYAPPQTIHFFDDGKLNRPFVYGYDLEMDMETFKKVYTPNQKKHYINFFVKGEEYKLLGLIKTNIHLFGVDKGEIFIFGTDKMGRDVFSRILAGLRISLAVSLFGVFISTIIACVMGGIAGYYGGRADMIIMRIVEILKSIPQLPLWMTLSAALPPEWSSIKVFVGIIFILALIKWAGFARTLRAKLLSYREEDFIAAAKAIGASDSRIIFVHLLPKSMSYIIVKATLQIPALILVETSLSFLGLGIKAPMVSMGTLLQQAQNVRSVVSHPWLLIPAIPLILTILALNFMGDALRDAVDPFSTG